MVSASLRETHIGAFWEGGASNFQCMNFSNFNSRTRREHGLEQLVDSYQVTVTPPSATHQFFFAAGTVP